jgi:hypothetical protein
MGGDSGPRMSGAWVVTAGQVFSQVNSWRLLA